MHSETNDVKLTAYALGELTGDEAREIEARLATDEEARREVEAMRALAGELTDELAKEPLPDAMPAPRVMTTRRWPARLALAAAASIVIGGMTAAIVLPILEPARYSTRRGMSQPAGDVTWQQIESSSPPPAYAATSPGQDAKVTNDDILRHPANWPDISDLQQQQAISAQRQEIAYTFDTSMRNAREALRNNNPTEAQLQIERARAARSANPQLFTEAELRSVDAAVSTAQSTVEDAKRQAQQQDDARQRSATERSLDQRRRVAAGERERTVSNLASTAAQLEREGRTQEAQGIRDQIAVIDPQNKSLSGTVSAAAPAPAPGAVASNADKTPDFNLQQTGSAKDGLFGGKLPEQANVQPNPFVGVQRDSLVASNDAKKPLGMPREANESTLLPTDEFAQDGAGPPARNVGPMNTEAYDRVVDNAFLDVAQNPLSTFSIDVDTASYSNVRRFLTEGQLPPKDAVRIEELVNYFPYEYAAPAQESEHPFKADVEVTQCPWKPEHRLVRVALKGMEIAKEQRPPSNLVFLIDVSGSMKPENKLPLLKESMKLLVNELKPTDRVAMVVYAGSSGLVLQSTPAGQKDTILAALDRLQSGGSTNGAQGIELAYSTAVSNFIKDGINRVILCTDGDFNVGVTNQGDLTRMIEEKTKTGVFLSVLGFGMGNVKDSTMEKLADKGNGNYAYIDTLAEGKKVLVDQMSSTLVTIAKDVKIQIEFNPAVARAYRLIGYENRMLAKEDFNDDKKDAGEIGAGHTVTALYEVVPSGQPIALPGTDPLKYQPAVTKPADDQSRELMTLKLRYKAPDGDVSKLMAVPVADAGKQFAQASSDLKFASGVAAFGMILRDSPHKGAATFGAVTEWAQDGVGRDEAGYRKEFMELVKKAKELKPQ